MVGGRKPGALDHCRRPSPSPNRRGAQSISRSWQAQRVGGPRRRAGPHHGEPRAARAGAGAGAAKGPVAPPGAVLPARGRSPPHLGVCGNDQCGVATQLLSPSIFWRAGLLSMVDDYGLAFRAASPADRRDHGGCEFPSRNRSGLASAHLTTDDADNNDLTTLDSDQLSVKSVVWFLIFGES